MKGETLFRVVPTRKVIHVSYSTEGCRQNWFLKVIVNPIKKYTYIRMSLLLRNNNILKEY